jgi:anti-sigma factor RsiW
MSDKLKNNILRWLKGFMLRHMYRMITCREFEDFITDYLDNELSASQRSRFELHIRLCKECKQYLQAYQRTMEVSRATFLDPDAALPDDVPEDLIRAILKSRSR